MDHGIQGSWNITNADGTIVAEGIAGTTSACIDMDACNTINMFDSFGDGWNGGSIDVAGESFGLPAGATGTALLGTCVVVCDYSSSSIG